jgi:hypothetical protein
MEGGFDHTTTIACLMQLLEAIAVPCKLTTPGVNHNWYGPLYRTILADVHDAIAIAKWVNARWVRGMVATVSFHVGVRNVGVCVTLDTRWNPRHGN